MAGAVETIAEHTIRLTILALILLWRASLWIAGEWYAYAFREYPHWHPTKGHLAGR